MALEDHPTSTTIPTEPKPSPSQPASEPSKPARARRRIPNYPGPRFYALKLLKLQAHRLDRFLVRLSNLFANPASTDALLATLGYTLEFVAALLSRFLTHRLTSVAATIAEKADDVLLPGESFTATLPTTPTDQRIARVVTSSKALAALLADYRIFVRLWGLAGLYTWARGTWQEPLANEAGTKERVVRRITWVQIASLVVFQVLENGAYLASKGVLTSESWSGEQGKSKEGLWYMWSIRFWAVHVALEIVRVGVLRYYADPPVSTLEKEKELVSDGEKEGKLLLEKKKRERWAWWRDAASNIAYMPMTLHWSVEEEKGFLSDWGVGVLGAVAGGALLVDAWKQTA